MFERLFPKERDFFQIFDRISSCLSVSIAELISAVEAKDGIEFYILKIKQSESEAESLSRQTVEQLHETFITPFDRVHIFQFVTQLREITTRIRLVTEKVHHYQIHQIPAETIGIAVKCGEVCQVIRSAVEQLKKLKGPSDVLDLCMSIYRMRADADELSLKASVISFQQEKDVQNLIKIRDINQDLISIIQKSEKLAFLIEEIVLEYA